MSRVELKTKAKNQLGNEIFSENWVTAVLVMVIVSLVGAISGGINLVMNAGDGVISESGINIAFGGASSVFSIISLIVTGPFSFAADKMFLKQARDGEKMEITDVICGFKEDFTNLFLIHLVGVIKTILWGLLFIVPGIMKAIAYSMAYYIKADNPDYDWRMCLSESERIMKGHKGEYFMLELSFIGWEIVGALCLGIGTFWVTAYKNAATAHFYEAIKGSSFNQTEAEF